MIQQKTLFALPTLLAMFILAGCSDSSNRSSAPPVVAPDPAPAPACTVVAPEALQMCIEIANEVARGCYSDSNAACADDDVEVAAALSTLQEEIEGACADGDLMSLSVDAAVGRFQNACQTQADSIAWRTFGGPHGAVWPTATDEEQSCLQTAHETASQFFDESLAAVNLCLAAAHPTSMWCPKGASGHRLFWTVTSGEPCVAMAVNLQSTYGWPRRGTPSIA